MKRRPTLFLALLAFLVLGCSDYDSPASPSPTVGVRLIPLRLVPDQHLQDPSIARDDVEIVGVELGADTLELAVTYAGGCREHDFQLVVGDGWRESDPVQVTGFVSHDAHGDMCEAQLSLRLRVDLTALKVSWRASYQSQSGVLLLHISGAGGPIRYVF